MKQFLLTITLIFSIKITGAESLSLTPITEIAHLFDGKLLIPNMLWEPSNYSLATRILPTLQQKKNWEDLEFPMGLWLMATKEICRNPEYIYPTMALLIYGGHKYKRAANDLISRQADAIILINAFRRAMHFLNKAAEKEKLKPESLLNSSESILDSSHLILMEELKICADNLKLSI